MCKHIIDRAKGKLLKVRWDYDLKVSKTTARNFYKNLEGTGLRLHMKGVLDSEDENIIVDRPCPKSWQFSSA